MKAALILFLGLPFYACFSQENSVTPETDSLSVLTYTTATGRQVIKNADEWPKKRAQILTAMQEAMGPLPHRNDLPPMDMKVVDSLAEGNHIRYSIIFTVAKDEHLPALLYVPIQNGAPKKLPAMLVLQGTSMLGKHQTSGQSPNPNRAYSPELADRGYVVVAPDYPGYGDLQDYNFKTDRYQSGTMKGIFNHMRCVDLLQSIQDVDPERIGVIGHSLGGHNSMFVAAFDTRLKVIVSSSGWTLFDHYDIGEAGSKKFGGKLGPWAQQGYMPFLKDKYKLDASKFPFDFDEVIATLAPRPFFSNSPLNDSNFNVHGVKKGITQAKQVYELLNVPDNLQAKHPAAGHDFPPAERLEAYRLIDRVLKHTPNKHQLWP